MRSLPLRFLLQIGATGPEGCAGAEQPLAQVVRLAVHVLLAAQICEVSVCPSAPHAVATVSLLQLRVSGAHFCVLPSMFTTMVGRRLRLSWFRRRSRRSTQLRPDALFFVLET